MSEDLLYELVCSRCDCLFWVSRDGQGEDWLCESCQQARDEAADAHAREQWHGGNGPQSERERDEVLR